MSRAVVNVATGHYLVGQERLRRALYQIAPDVIPVTFVGLSAHWPTHAEKPYGFKAYALKETAAEGFAQLLWADACIIPIRSMEPIWQHAKDYGVWMCANYGFSNYTWTADSAYPDLFPLGLISDDKELSLTVVRETSRFIPHAIATAFAIDLDHSKGRAFLDEYYRLASETQAFCGPWTNGPATPDGRTAPCGPPEVKGHRHDQTAASVIAWRLGVILEDPPRLFAYKGGETEETILVADGAY